MDCIQYLNQNESLKLVVGLEVDGDLIPIVNNLIKFINTLNIGSENLCFVDVTDDAFKKYFKKIQPFYSKNNF